MGRGHAPRGWHIKPASPAQSPRRDIAATLGIGPACLAWSKREVAPGFHVLPINEIAEATFHLQPANVSDNTSVPQPEARGALCLRSSKHSHSPRMGPSIAA